MSRGALLGAAAVLAACAGPKVWTRDGATQDDFYRDRGQCQAQAFSVPNVPVMQAALVFNSCMQGKGWHQTQAPSS